MTESRRYGWRSLRFKLVLASVVVEALMLTVLVWNSTRITGNAMQEIFQNRTEVLVPLLNASLANPLAQRDFATLDERLRRIVRKESLVYIEVRDELGQLAASRGGLPAVPHLDRSIESARDVLDQEFDITLAGRTIGRARYGLNVSLLEATLANLRKQGVLVASAEIVLSVLLLATLGALLTRHLLTLAQAARALQGGDYSMRVPAAGRDEVADTARAFNAMAETLARDSAERRRAEAALRQSEQRLRDLIDGLGPQMFVGLMTPEGTLIEVNRPALAAAGLKPEDVLGKQVEQSYWWSYSEEAQQRLHATVVRAAQGEASRYDAQVRVGANQFIYIDFSLQPLRDETGKVQYLIGSANIITERKLAEQALIESEERLRLALDAAHMGTFDWDVPANRITWSRWHEELWGFKPGEFGGTYEAFTARVHPDDLPGIDAEVARCIAARAPFAREFRVVWPDGSVHWISARGEFTFDADGQPLRMRGAVVEFTARKQAERQIAEYAERLEHLSRQLLAAQEDERRRLAREMHDELGQALTAIKINLQARGRFKDQSPAELDAENVRLVEDAIQQVRRLALALRPSMLDDLGLAPALRWIADQTAERGGFSVQLGADFPDARPAPDLETTCFRIAQEALTNIARHAQAKRVAIELRHEGDTLLMTVQDDGRGFDVVEARARATAGGSVGVLGMQERAELAGGKIEIESAPGQGTVVRARFPWRAAGEDA